MLNKKNNNNIKNERSLKKVNVKRKVQKCFASLSTFVLAFCTFAFLNQETVLAASPFSKVSQVISQTGDDIFQNVTVVAPIIAACIIGFWLVMRQFGGQQPAKMAVWNERAKWALIATGGVFLIPWILSMVQEFARTIKG